MMDLRVKKEKIKRNPRIKKSDSYKKFGPWKVKFSDNAKDELCDDSVFSESDVSKIQKIVKELETKPFQGSFGQHPLWEFHDTNDECVIWSAEINKENRLNYLIFKQLNYILVTNLIGHYVVDTEYAKRPKI